MPDCPSCGTAVPDPMHELVDDDGNVEEEWYACPSCSHTWEVDV